MTAIGAGYDLSASTYSPEGRIFQVEYANKAVENSGTVIGLRVKDGIVLAVEKMIHSKLLVPGVNRRIQTVDKHAGLATAGLIADARHLAVRAQDEGSNFSDTYRAPIPIEVLANRLGQYCQVFTCYSSVRPFGLTSILGGIEPETGKPALYCIEPSGVYFGYRGCAVGKGRQLAKTEIEKLPLETMTVEEAVNEAALIIHKVHDDGKDKEFELEMTWIGPQSNGLHLPVPKELQDQAEIRAKDKLKEDMET